MRRALWIMTMVATAPMLASSCKKPSDDSEPGAAAKGPSSARGTPSRENPRAARTAPGEPRSASALCSKGARPDRPLEKEQYRLTVEAPGEATPGERAVARITVIPRGGYKYNVKYPSELVLKGSTPGVELERRKYEKGQAKTMTKARLVMEVAYTPRTAGRKVIHGELGFSVCTPKLCITEPDMCVAWETTAK